MPFQLKISSDFNAFLHLQLKGFSTSASPRIPACVTRPSPLVGGVWARDYSVYTLYQTPPPLWVGSLVLRLE